MRVTLAHRAQGEASGLSLSTQAQLWKDTSVAVNGVALTALGAGTVLLWSALENQKITATLQDIIKGQKPAAGNPEGVPAAAGASGGTAAADTAAVSGSAGSVKALAQVMAAAKGWTGAQWAALNNVEMAEAGWNLNAKNPTSAAYGIAQFINGPGEYAQYGGNSTTAAGQITAFLNYVEQRYGTPEAAWAHEQQFGWY
jgi:hypothetical protein